jgi:hypothetical protein
MTQQIKLESQLMLALFKCTIEQSQHLTKQYKHKLAHDFAMWQQHGFKVLAHFERDYPEHFKEIENISDQIHNLVAEAKKLARSCTSE